VASKSSSFGCNLDAVDATAKQLGQVRDELKNFGRRDDAYVADLASQRIVNALNTFHKDSSDQRDKITGTVEALANMLQGLADGVREVDRALAGSLPDITEERVPPPVTAGDARRSATTDRMITPDTAFAASTTAEAARS
jgi:ABC-type transporter Mla subunit MlaD